MPHIHELIDYTVEVFIVHEDKVLIRKHDKYKTRNCPGWHIELDENPNEAAISEAKEETGLDIVLYDPHRRATMTPDSTNFKELIPPVFLNIHRIPNSNHQHVWLVYIAYSKSPDVEPQNLSDASHERKRMSVEDLETTESLFENVRLYGGKAIEAYKR